MTPKVMVPTPLAERLLIVVDGLSRALADAVREADGPETIRADLRSRLQHARADLERLVPAGERGPFVREARAAFSEAETLFREVDVFLERLGGLSGDQARNAIRRMIDTSVRPLVSEINMHIVTLRTGYFPD